MSGITNDCTRYRKTDRLSTWQTVAWDIGPCGDTLREARFFYLDPSYWETEGYGVAFPFEEYLAMAARLREVKGEAIVSLNDHPAIREAFAAFEMEVVDISYWWVAEARRPREKN